MTQVMTRLYRVVVRVPRAQTMTEYALILAAVAIVVFVGYQTMGDTVLGLVNTVDGLL